MNLHTRLITGLVFTAGMLVVAEPLLATPDGSQRLRGMGDRVFLVMAELTEDRLGIPLPIGTRFPNCYIFAGEPDADGYNWFESAFPTARGNWTQDSNGARTSYVVAAMNGTDVIGQWGEVTPARGTGNLQLTAISTVDIIPGGMVELEFFSVGEEIDASEVESRCPTMLIPMPPE